MTTTAPPTFVGTTTFQVDGSPLMSETLHAPAPATRRVKGWRFLRHYLEMVLAMFVGMAVLGPLESLVFDAMDWSETLDRTDVGSLAMATNMTVGMAAWMRVRGHRWAPIAEMGAAMFLPFVVLLVPWWMGAISAGTVMLWGHVLMMVAMLLAMVLRLDEYTSAHHR